jgi:hypothetical protein
VREDAVRLAKQIIELTGVKPEKLAGDDPDWVLQRAAERAGGQASALHAALKMKLPAAEARDEAIRAAATEAR